MNRFTHYFSFCYFNCWILQGVVETPISEASMKMAVFLDATSRSLAETDQRFASFYCLHSSPWWHKQWAPVKHRKLSTRLRSSKHDTEWREQTFHTLLVIWHGNYHVPYLVLAENASCLNNPLLKVAHYYHGERVINRRHLVGHDNLSKPESLWNHNPRGFISYRRRKTAVYSR
jgi:hypothetical protein